MTIFRKRLSVACRSFNIRALFSALLFVVDNLDDFAALFIDLSKEQVLLSDENMDNLRRFGFFLDLQSLWLLQGSSEDESKPGGEGDGEVRTRSFTGSTTSWLTISVAYRERGAMAAMFFASAEAIISISVGAVAI